MDNDESVTVTQQEIMESAEERAQRIKEALAAEAFKKSTPITGLKAISDYCAKPVELKFVVGEPPQPCIIKVRVLKPFEIALTRLILQEVGNPPLLKGFDARTMKTGDMPPYDYGDPGYRKRMDEVSREARDMACFWGCQEMQDLMLGEGVAGAEVCIKGMHQPENRKPICAWVEQHFVDDILGQIYDKVTRSEVTVPRLVNFSQPGGNETSQS